MPVSWIVQEIIARHAPPDWRHPNRELIEYGCRQTLRRMVRACLGLPDDDATTDDHPNYSATALRAQAAAFERHAEALLSHRAERKREPGRGR
jgi:hypothetical protein